MGSGPSPLTCSSSRVQTRVDRGLPPSSGWMMKGCALQDVLKCERQLQSMWSLQLCFGRVVYHGAKWKWWKLAHSDGSMAKFVKYRLSRTARARKWIYHSPGRERFGGSKSAGPCTSVRDAYGDFLHRARCSKGCFQLVWLVVSGIAQFCERRPFE